MNSQLIMNITLGETRIARLDDKQVVELHIERSHDLGIVGNVYKGRVVRVLPGMQAAFVDIGLERTAFLHAHDIADISPTDEGHKDHGEEGEELLHEKPVNRRRSRRGPKATIQSLLKEGNEILVQVTKEPLGTKGARLTSHISLPGRHLVYMPTVDHIGISRRIEDDSERRRLRELVEKNRSPQAGFIVRTASESLGARGIKADMAYLTKLWKKITDISRRSKPPTLVHAELDMVLRVVRDLFTDDIDTLVVDSHSEFKRILKFMQLFMPKLRSKVQLYEGEKPLFDAYGVEVEITRALGQKVWLKSGGYIIIQETEAVTTIDVNTGRFVGKQNLEDTIVRTNLEAVKEIVCQLRLRNMGGIIILDFIDMNDLKNRSRVYNALKEALKADRARTSITKISELGLVEMTRKRTRETIGKLLTDPCPYCEGKGYLKSSQTICYEIFRGIIREVPSFKNRQISVEAHPSVANMLYDEERSSLEELENLIGCRISVKATAEYHLEQFEISEKSPN